MAAVSENSQDHPESIRLFHLVWAPLGLDRFRRFLDSYRTNPAGVPHRLHILFNGFDSADQTEPYRQLLMDLPHDTTILTRPVQDIQAYLDAARLVDTEYVCFLNSYSVILHSGWLATLFEFVRRGNVGMVGATGCHESFRTALRITRWRAPLGLGRAVQRWPGKLMAWTRDELRWRLRCWRARWLYEEFPNPHIRSNAFLLRRQVLLGFGFGPVRNKRDALLFENGKNSLTRRIMRSGQDVLVIGADRRGYRVDEWPTSQTFRNGDQANVLIADNRTRDYLAATADMRRLLARLAWGEPNNPLDSVIASRSFASLEPFPNPANVDHDRDQKQSAGASGDSLMEKE